MDKQLLAVIKHSTPRQLGLTLVELMIALALSGSAMAAIIMSFRSQETSSTIQVSVTDMQQNLGAALQIMAKEIRMAGYDPAESGTPAIGTATSSSLQFTLDFNRDGDVGDANENITYGFATADDDANANTPVATTAALVDATASNGVADLGVAALGRNTGGGSLDMAENIEAYNFAYAYDTDNDGAPETYTLTTGPNVGQPRTIWAFNSGGTWFNLDRSGDGLIDAADGPGAGATGTLAGLSTGTTFNLGQIRAVRIWILARSDRQDAKYTNTNTYTVGRQVITRNDRYYRRLMTTTVTCRNMGL